METVLEGVLNLAGAWSANRHDRQRRRHLERADFDALRDAGWLRVAVPRQHGGLWDSVRASTRPICNALRTLAGSDSSVALVSAMHPAVLAYWLGRPDGPGDTAWRHQCEQLFGLARAGEWFGTLTSEPGSGGDIMRSRATARRDGEQWRLRGVKHFGSGSGITSFMVTTAVPDGEDRPEWFVIDMRDRAWDGSQGLILLGEWDGHGMTATQSHSLELADVPALRMAWRGGLEPTASAAGVLNNAMFSAVITGIVETAIELARHQTDSWRDQMNAYQRTEWARADREAWLCTEALEAALREIEAGEPSPRALWSSRIAIAELSESCLRRLTNVLGGACYQRHSPFGFWHQDVRALSFLRPPLPLAYDALTEAGTGAPAS